MRIVAGTLGGRTFASPHSFKTHPMSDKIRGALFNMLGDIEGLTALDAFAGSGALSFEAVSRGAASALAIDNDRAAQKIIVRNVNKLGLQRQVQCIEASANAWLQTNPDRRFDIVLCDPPYNDLHSSLITKLADRITDNGVLVVSWPGSADTLEIPGYKKIAHRTYGDAQLIVYARS